MNVRHQGDLDALPLESCLDRPQILGVADRRGGDPDDFAVGLDEPDDLLDGRLSIACVRRGHRLDTNGVGSTHRHISHRHYTRLATLVMTWTGAIWQC